VAMLSRFQTLMLAIADPGRIGRLDYSVLED
jgi:hypothetical protein